MMWIQDHEGSLVNLKDARHIYSAPNDSMRPDEAMQIIAEWDPTLTDGRVVIFQGSEDGCQVFMDWLASYLKVPVKPYYKEFT